MKNFFINIGAFFVTFGCVFQLLPNTLNLRKSIYSPVSTAELRLNAVILGDTHVDGNAFRDRNNIIRKTLSGLSRCSQKPDALVIAGDLTNSGAKVEYRNFRRMLRFYCKVEQLLPEMGNHDSRGTSEDRDYKAGKERFLSFCNTRGIDTDKVYYSYEINGYSFIMLGTEKALNDQSFISEQQLSWLDSTLKSASKNNKPVFIVGHQPLCGTHGTDSSSQASILGEQSDDVASTIRRYTDKGLTALYISGHLHAELSENTFETVSRGFHCLNLPSAQFSSGGGEGYVLEAYDDGIILRARNFLTGEEHTEYKIMIGI